MNFPGWYPEEIMHAGPEHLDSDYVDAYDRKAGTDPATAVAHLLALRLDKRHTLVDMGAGTGTFAIAVAPLCRRVVAVDVSAVMLEHLRAKAARLGITNIILIGCGSLFISL